MLLGGLWHGASFNFILWGGLHGTALAIHKLWNEKARQLSTKWSSTNLYKIFAITITFHFVCFCWIFFKAENFTVANEMIGQILHHFNGQAWLTFAGNYKPVLLLMLLAALLHAVPENYSDKISFQLQRFGLAGFTTLFLLFLLIYGYFKGSEAVMPIYLQF